MDNITSEHVGKKLFPLLTFCFTGLVFCLTGSIILVPIIKDKVDNVTSLDNYRPIAIAAVCPKCWRRFY